MVTVINVLLDIVRLVKELALTVVGELVAMVLGGYLLGVSQKVRVALMQFRADVKEAGRARVLKAEHDAHHINCYDCEFWRTKYFYLYASKGELLKYGAYLGWRNRQSYLGSQGVVDF